MRMRRVALATAVFGLATGLAACGGEDGDAGSGYLDTVANYVAGETGSVDFVDWTALQDAYDGADLGSDSSEEEVTDFLLRIAEDTDIGPLYSASVASRETVGFAPTDLAWEASVFSDGPPVKLIGFEEDFDTSAVSSALEDCGYQSSEVEGGTLYETDPVVGCANGSLPIPELSAIALLPDQNLAIAALSGDAVEDALEAGEDSSGFEAVVEDLSPHLDGVVAGDLRYGEEACPPLVGGGTNATPEQIEEIQADLGELSESYEDLFVGYREAGEGVEGLVVMDFADSGAAEADLEARADVAENGTSAATARPLSDIFTLASSETDDDAIVLGFEPIEGGPLPLLQAALNADLPFAACPAD